MFVADEQSDVTVDVVALTQLAGAVLEAERVRGACELALTFVDEGVIADLNRRFLAGDGPTDVLAFPIDDELVQAGRAPDASTSGPDRPPVPPGDVPFLLGDVVVCPAVAARNAAARGSTTDHELELLVVHGILHVLGMDHADPDGAAAMGERQRDLLARFVPDAPAPPDPEAAPVPHTVASDAVPGEPPS